MRIDKLARPALLTAFVLLAALAQFACGGSSSVAGPTPSPGGSPNLTISIVGMNGDQSFAPDSATVTVGHTVVFKNNDTTTHRIVQDQGAFDTGNLAPGATSAVITINTASPLPYHCSIHPTMVGGINTVVAGRPDGPVY